MRPIFIGITLTLVLAIPFLSFLGSASPASAAAGINKTINFQGKLVDKTNGTNIANGTYNMEFKIWDASSAGSNLWTESRLVTGGNGVLVTDGIFQVNLGSVTAISGVNFNTDNIYLGINLGSTNGSCTPFSSCTPDGEMSPRVRFTASPYAFNSDNLQGIAATGFVQLGQSASAQTDASSNPGIFVNKTVSGNQLQLQSSGTDVFTLSLAGDQTFGQNANHTISVTQTATNAAGKNLSVSAGAGGTGASTNAGGTLALQGGAGGGTNGNGGALTIDAGVKNGSGTDGTISIGVTTGSAVTISRSGVTTTVGGALTIAASQNLTLTSGTGAFIQTYSGSAAANAQSLTMTNTNAGGTSIALTAEDVTLVGTATSGGINTNTAFKFENPTAQTNNVFYGLNFVGASYTDVLRVNSTQIINGSGVVQSAGVSGSYTGITGVGTLTAGTWTATAIGAQFGGTGINTSGSNGIPSINAGTWATNTVTQNGVVYGAASNGLSFTGVGTTGQCLNGNTGAAPTWGGCSGSGALLQAPTTTAANTITPATTGVVGLTVNGNITGTNAVAEIINQAGTADALQVNTSNSGTIANGIIESRTAAGTTTNGLAVVNNQASATTTNGLQLTNTAGTFTTGVNFTGTFTNLIAAPNFTVSNTGVQTLGGGQSVDITSLVTTNVGSSLTFQPGITSTATSTGATLTLQAGNDSGATASTGGVLTLKGGDATGAATKTSGGVNIDVGAGTTLGSILVGTNTDATITVGRTTGTGQLTLGQSAASNTVSIGSANPNASATQAINIGNGLQTTASSIINVNILSNAGNGTNGTATLSLGNSDRVTQIDVGNVVADAARSINIATGAAVAIDTINIGTGATAVASGKLIHIGDGSLGASGTNLITIGSLTNASTLALQGGTGSTALTLVTGATGGAAGTITVGNTTGANTQTINIGNNATGASSTTLVIGSNIGTSPITIQGGSNGVVVRPTAGTTAFAVQNGTSKNVLGADTSNGYVLIGNASAGGVNGTLVVYNATNTNTITIATGATSSSYSLTLPTAAPSTSQCVKTDSVTASTLTFATCGGGVTRKVYLVPEFPGAVMYADGSSNSGTLTAEFDATNRHNYYNWTTSQTALQDYDVIIRSQIPSEYTTGFGTLKIWVYGNSTSTANNDIKVTVKDNSGTTCVSAATILPGSATTWTEQAVTLTGCSYAANDLLTIDIAVFSKSANAVRVGEMSYLYTN